MAGTPRKSSKIPAKRGAPRPTIGPQPSAPELKVGYSPAGRETLHAIEEEQRRASASAGDAPLIEISEAPAGRETLAAITEELAESMRPRQNTLRYGDRISNAPGAKAPRRKSEPPTEPTLALGSEPAARESSASASAAPRPRPPSAKPSPARAAALRAPAASASNPAAPLPAPVVADLEIFELVTFIVRGQGIGDVSSDALRRRFVEQHLLQRTPARSLDAVERVEMTPWTAHGTMVVRVWCRA